MGEQARLALRRAVELLATQDNAITADPIFLVQERKRLYGLDPEFCERYAYVNHEDSEPVAEDKDAERFARFEAGEFREEEDGEEKTWTRTGYVDRWEFVQPFLTREAAEAFRKREAHHHGETRIYVDSGCRNTEWQWLRAALPQLLRDTETLERHEAFLRAHGKLLVAGFVRTDGSEEAAALLAEMEEREAEASAAPRKRPRVIAVRLRSDRVQIIRDDAPIVSLSFAEVALAARLLREHLLKTMPPEIPKPDSEAEA